MPSPFPGMDPYLEEPSLWPDVHARVIAALGAALTPLLRPKYRAGIEQQLRIHHAAGEATGQRSIKPDMHLASETPAATAGDTATATRISRPAALDALQQAAPMQAHTMPDLERLKSVVIRSVADRRVVCVLELISPANKSGMGRDLYQRKRLSLMESTAHLVEIDLIRAGEPLIDVGQPLSPPPAYVIHVSPAYARPDGYLWPLGLRDPLPSVPIPLDPEDGLLWLDLAATLGQVYDEGAFDLAVDYRQPPPAPPLSDEDTAWLRGRLAAASAPKSQP